LSSSVAPRRSGGGAGGVATLKLPGATSGYAQSRNAGTFVAPVTCARAFTVDFPLKLPALRNRLNP